MGKTRDLFKKMKDTKGTFHAEMVTIKDRNGMDLTKAEDIKKRWQEYTKKLRKKDLKDPDNHDGMITHLEPDILECKVKWALGSIITKLMEVMEFQLNYFKSWNPKISCCESVALNMPAYLIVATGLERVSFHANPKERQCQRMLKLPYNCIHLTC